VESDTSTTKQDEVGRTRILTGLYRIIFIVFSAAGLGIAIFYIFHFSLFGWTFIDIGYFYMFIALFLPLVFLIFPIYTGLSSKIIPWYDIILAALCFLISLYFFLNTENIIYKAWEISPPTLAKFAGLVLCILVLEAGRRTGGNVLFLICFFCAILPLFADRLPTFIGGASFPFWFTVSLHAMGRETIVGLPTRVVATTLIGFLIFGVTLSVIGGGKAFLDLANSLLGRRRGGAAKSTVVACGLFGMISGSVTSNVATIGSATIPAMKKTGYPPYFAAAITACASTGGVLMPPVMGAVAFIMAGFLSIPYSTVALSAVIPSILYYTGLFVQADGFAARRGFKGLPRAELPALKMALKEGWPFLLALFVLVWFIFYERVEEEAPFYASGMLFILAMFKKESRLTKEKIIRWIENSGKVMAELTAILCMVGFIVGSLMITGVAHSFSYEILKLAGNNLYVILAFGAAASFLLGLGVTISACYIVLALIVAPSLIKMGIDPIAAHMFFLYWGVVSEITPPVAIGAFVAASMAGASPSKTQYQAMKIGICLYFIPFFFVLRPALVLRGPVPEIFYSFVVAFVGVFLIASAVEGYLLRIGELPIWLRILLFVGGLLLASPGWITDLGGFLIATVSLGLYFLMKALSHRKLVQKAYIGQERNIEE
jgi:TRAP transporter 4TM/12TM fusion protein